jgi:hypothetical protein
MKLRRGKAMRMPRPADKLAKDLGVSLIRVVNFSEVITRFIMASDALGMGGDVEMASLAPSVPTGEKYYY